jgi:hypothetical protein
MKNPALFHKLKRFLQTVSFLSFILFYVRDGPVRNVCSVQVTDTMRQPYAESRVSIDRKQNLQYFWILFK